MQQQNIVTKRMTHSNSTHLGWQSSPCQCLWAFFSSAGLFVVVLAAVRSDRERPSSRSRLHRSLGLCHLSSGWVVHWAKRQTVSDTDRTLVGQLIVRYYSGQRGSRLLFRSVTYYQQKPT